MKSASPLLSVVVSTCPERSFLPDFVARIDRQCLYVPASKGPRYARRTLSPATLDVNGGAEIVAVSDGEYNLAVPTSEFPFRLLSVPKASPSCFGHNTRAAGIRAAAGRYVWLQNDDNVIFDGAFQQIKDALVRANYPDVLLFDCVNNLLGWTVRRTEISIGRIDLGCGVVSSGIARAVGFAGTRYEADFDFWIAVKPLASRIATSPAVLFAHQ